MFSFHPLKRFEGVHPGSHSKTKSGLELPSLFFVEMPLWPGSTRMPACHQSIMWPGTAPSTGEGLPVHTQPNPAKVRRLGYGEALPGTVVLWGSSVSDQRGPPWLLPSGHGASALAGLQQC